MNYLAHLFLSPNNDLIRIGNLAGDFIKGINQAQLPEEIQQGIILHRAIDKFTDAHPVVARSKKRIRPLYSRFSGVLIDIFYDHFLADHWHTYSNIALTDFSQNIYGLLDAHQTVLPPRLQRIAPIMRAEDWLTSYQTASGIEQTLNRLQTRLKYNYPLAAAIDDLSNQYDNLQEDFLDFFPDVMIHASVYYSHRAV